MKRNLGRLAMVFASAAVGLFLSEAIVRMFFPGDSPLFLDIYRLDDRGLLGMTPDVTRRHAAREWDVTIAIDGGGLRDRTPPRSDTAGRVLALGDSFAFGWGVELEESYLYQAEDLLPPGWRIVKAGIPGTGTLDQGLWLEAHGARYRPSVVLVSFYVGNDFVDVAQGGVARQFTVQDGLMVRRDPSGKPPALESRLIDRLKRSSLLAQRLAASVYAWRRTRSATAEGARNPGLEARDPWLLEFARIHLADPPRETAAAFDATLRELDGVRAWCDANGATMALAIIPRSFQIYDWELEKWCQAFAIPPAALDLDRPQRILSSWAHGRGVPALDLAPALRACARAHPEERLYFYPNGHMNAAGNACTARALAPFIEHTLTR